MPLNNPGIAHSITIRVHSPGLPGILGQITSAIGDAGGDITTIATVDSLESNITRDITINARDVNHRRKILRFVRAIDQVRIQKVMDPVFERHMGGKLEVVNRSPVKTTTDMSLIYTPGVGRVSMAVYNDPSRIWDLTGKGNTVAIVSDGTAVLGLGDIGPGGAMPVMEGKAVLFKQLAGVNAWPIVLETKDPDEIVEVVKTISVGFGGINLEDISSPRCFYIEERLKNDLDIPIFHDDQHGTAVVVMAGLLNALKLTQRHIDEVKIVLSGVGAGGIASAKMLLTAGAVNIVGVDRSGIVYRGRDNGGNVAKDEFAKISNPDNIQGDLAQAMEGADVFLGLSGPNTVTKEMVTSMNHDPIVFAMANPDPEILPEHIRNVAKVIATGRSDYPNQINNALCFPGIFQGALKVRATTINEDMKLAAARAISMGVSRQELSPDYIIPSIFNLHVVKRVAKEVALAAIRSGVARIS